MGPVDDVISNWVSARTVIVLTLVGALTFATLIRDVDAARPIRDQVSTDLSAVLGTWAGRSTCVGDRPACKNEDVVYRFLAVDGKSGAVTLLADKLIDGKREPMYLLQFDYKAADHSLACEFRRGQTHGLWAYTVSGDTMTGTLVVLPNRELGRRVNVKRVSESEVPPAPPRDQYASLIAPPPGAPSHIEPAVAAD